jgi:hypothetical protein
MNPNKMPNSKRLDGSAFAGQMAPIAVVNRVAMQRPSAKRAVRVLLVMMLNHGSRYFLSLSSAEVELRLFSHGSRTRRLKGGSEARNLM